METDFPFKDQITRSREENENAIRARGGEENQDTQPILLALLTELTIYGMKRRT